MQQLRWLNWSTCVLAAALASCGDAASMGLEDIDSDSSSDIVNGRTYSGLPAVGLVSLPGALCTGALIAPHVVLTAGHCVGRQATEFDTSADAFEVTDGTHRYRVASKHVSVMAPWVQSGDGNYDQAIITLAQDIPVATLPLMDTVSLSSVGKSVFLVGYGITGDGRRDAGTKRAVNGVVSGIDTHHLMYGNVSGTVCSGDSGGPVLHQKADGSYEVAATNRVVYSPFCASTADGTRVDTHRAWINSVLAQAGIGTYGSGAPSTSQVIPTVGNAAMCLDVYYGRTQNGTPVQLYDCNASAPQQWSYERGAVKALGKCLSTASTAAGASLRMWDCDGTPSQTWVGEGTKLRLAYTQMCAEVPNANFQAWQQLRLWPCNGSVAQQLRVPFQTATTSTVKSSLKAGYCLDVRGANSADGNTVQVYACNGTAAQSWTINSVSGTAAALGKCLGAPGTPTSGSPAQLFTCTAAQARRWLKKGNTLQLQGTTLCLGLPGSAVENSRPLQLWGCNGSGAQSWTF